MNIPGFDLMIFGMSTDEAKERGICVDCKQPITDTNIYSEAGKVEYAKTGLCELCFDEITEE